MKLLTPLNPAIERSLLLLESRINLLSHNLQKWLLIDNKQIINSYSGKILIDIEHYTLFMFLLHKKKLNTKQHGKLKKIFLTRFGTKTSASSHLQFNQDQQRQSLAFQKAPRSAIKSHNEKDYVGLIHHKAMAKTPFAPFVVSLYLRKMPPTLTEKSLGTAENREIKSTVHVKQQSPSL